MIAYRRNLTILEGGFHFPTEVVRMVARNWAFKYGTVLSQERMVFRGSSGSWQVIGSKVGTSLRIQVIRICACSFCRGSHHFLPVFLSKANGMGGEWLPRSAAVFGNHTNEPITHQSADDHKAVFLRGFVVMFTVESAIDQYVGWVLDAGSEGSISSINT